MSTILQFNVTIDIVKPFSKRINNHYKYRQTRLIQPKICGIFMMNSEGWLIKSI